MEVKLEADHRGRNVGVAVEVIDVNREYRDVIAVRPVARRRARAAIARDAEIGAALNRARRRQIGLQVAGVLGSSVAVAGILNTTQCQKPLPVGASGS